MISDKILIKYKYLYKNYNNVNGRDESVSLIINSHYLAVN